ncbi:MAG: hypothetical protein ACJ72I_21020 [Pseudonocardiaceae bacterium]
MEWDEVPGGLTRLVGGGVFMAKFLLRVRKRGRGSVGVDAPAGGDRLCGVEGDQALAAAITVGCGVCRAVGHPAAAG